MIFRCDCRIVNICWISSSIIRSPANRGFKKKSTEIIHTTLGIQHWTCLKPSHIISSIWRQGFYGVSNAVCSSIGHIIDQCVDSVVLGSVENLLASSFFLLTLTPLSQVVLFPNSSYVFSGLLIAYVVLLFASLGDPN